MDEQESKPVRTSKRKSYSNDCLWTCNILQERRDGIEEDSGLGDSVTFADEEASSSCQSYYSSPKILNRNGGSPQYAIASTNEKMRTYQESKRPRLDLPEEANELPEEKYSPGGQIDPPLLSFKNVALLSPLKAIQDNDMELKCTPAYAVQPLSIQRIAPATVNMTAKVDKVSKRAANRHHLDQIFPSTSQDGTAELQLLAQPEEQHRARYQTEGSRGAVKDRSGQGHPIIKLSGYNQPAVLVTYVAWDGGSVAPHMFYQAYKVSGKNSTPCNEDKIQGTTLLKMDLVPKKEMTVSCDCVGLLKERNVDVELRLKSPTLRGRRKSTKCRLVFRTTIKLESGAEETLQIVSEPICCTQPPGVPEISRKSLSFCSPEGGQELFIIGKNFFKDTKIIFQDKDTSDEPNPWKVTVTPDKDFLHQTHLICAVPPYVCGTQKEVEVQIIVTSCGKSSEANPFKFMSSCKEEISQLELTDTAQNVLSLTNVDNRKNKMAPLSETTPSLSLRKPQVPTRGHAIVHPIQIQRPFQSLQQYNRQGADTTRPRKACEHESVPTTAVSSVKSTVHQNGIATLKVQADSEYRYGETTKSNTVSSHTVMENLVEMLKLARNTPITTSQPAFVQMIADEILNQLKTDNCINPQYRKVDDSAHQQQLLPTTTNVSFARDEEEIKEEKYSLNDTEAVYSQQTIDNNQHCNSIDVIKQNNINPLPSVDTTLLTSSAAVKINEVKTPNYIISPQNGSLPLLGVEDRNAKISDAVNPICSIMFNTEYVQNSTIDGSHKKIKLRPVTVSRQTLLTNQQTFVNKEDGITVQNGYQSMNATYLPGQNCKLEQNNTSRLRASEINLSAVLPVSPVQAQLYTSVANANQSIQTSCLETNVGTTKLNIHNSTLFNNQPEMQHNQLNLPVHTINRNSTNSSQNILQNEPLTSNCHTLSYPFLTQATNSGQIYAPQQILQMESNGMSGPISHATSVNSTVSSEVTHSLEQLSESELINYINPNCFDSV